MLEQEAEEEAAKNEADKENTDSIEDEIDEEARKASARPKSGIMICIFFFFSLTSFFLNVGQKRRDNIS